LRQLPEEIETCSTPRCLFRFWFFLLDSDRCFALRDHSEMNSVFSDFHRARPGGITTGRLPGHTEDPLPALPSHSLREWEGREDRWSARSVADQLSPRWDKPSGSGMRQDVFRASIAEIESRQLAEVISESSLSGGGILPPI
jgi:hypothetical protein